MVPGQETNGDNLGKSFPSSMSNSNEYTQHTNSC